MWKNPYSAQGRRIHAFAVAWAKVDMRRSQSCAMQRYEFPEEKTMNRYLYAECPTCGHSEVVELTTDADPEIIGHLCEEERGHLIVVHTRRADPGDVPAGRNDRNAFRES